MPMDNHQYEISGGETMEETHQSRCEVPKKVIELDGNNLTIEDVISVARHSTKVALSQDGIVKMNRSCQMVRLLIEDKKVVYGITTGFGKFSNVLIDNDQTEQLQKNLIMSHATGIGNPFPVQAISPCLILQKKI